MGSSSVGREGVWGETLPFNSADLHIVSIYLQLARQLFRFSPSRLRYPPNSFRSDLPLRRHISLQQ